MNNLIQHCNGCGKDFPTDGNGYVVCPACGSSNLRWRVTDKLAQNGKTQRRLPVYIIVDISKSQDKEFLKLVKIWILQLSIKVTASPVIWGVEIWTSILTIGKRIRRVAPFAAGVSCDVSTLFASDAVSCVNDLDTLSTFVQNDLGVNPEDKEALWRKDIHAPIAVIISSDETLSPATDMQLSFFWKKPKVLAQFSETNAFSGKEFREHLSLTCFQDFGEWLFDRMDTWLDCEADRVPEWLENGWEK